LRTPPKEIVEVKPTERVCPKAAVDGTSGTGWRWARSEASISSGGRRVSRWGRAFTSRQKEAQARSRASNES
jgi:hypothetical protein